MLEGFDFILQSDFNPQAERVDVWLERTAWLVFFLLMAGALVIVYGIKYSVRDSEERRHLQAIRPQMLSASPEKQYFPGSNPRGSRQSQLNQLFDSKGQRPVGVREGITTVRADIAQRLSVLPPGIARAITEVLLLLVLATLALLALMSVDSWVLPSSGSGLGSLVNGVLVLIVGAGVIVAEGLRLIPGGEVVLLLRDPANAALAALAGALTVLVMVFVAVVTNELDEQVFAGERRVVQWVFALTRIIAGGLIALLSLILVVDGHVLAAAATMWAAGPVMWVGVIMAVVNIILLVHVTAPNGAGKVVTAGQRGVNDAVVRTKWLIFGAPIVLTVTAILVIAAWTESWLATIIGAVVVGVVTRLVLVIYGKLRYRLVKTTEPVHAVDEVAVSAFSVTDADGDEIYICEVDEYELAHRDRSALIDTAIEVIEWRLDGPPQSGPSTTIAENFERQPPKFKPALEHHYYQAAIENGRVDFGEVEESLRGDIESRIQASLREAGGEMDRQNIISELRDEYPEDVLEKALQYLEHDAGRVYENQGTLMLR